MKKVILWVLRGLSRVISLNDKLFLLLKDEAVRNPSEHLIRLVKLIQRNVANRTGMLILDVGAASGDSPLFFAKHFPECKTIGFEPIPAAFTAAQRKTASAASIELRNLALFDKPGERDFHITKNLVSSSLIAPDLSREASSGTGLFNDVVVQRVAVSTLDLQVPPDAKVLLIKLDTQGTELDVLKGAADTLKRTLFVLSEMNNHDDYKHACKYYEVDEWLRQNGFTLADTIASYRNAGRMIEYDAIYINERLVASAKKSI